MAYVGNTEPLLAFPADPEDGVDTYTSGTLNTDRNDYISGMVYSDQVGDIYIEQSGDGENWDISTTYAVAGADGKGFSEPLYGPYVRIRYVNGGVDQTEFRLFAKFTSAGDS